MKSTAHQSKKGMEKKKVAFGFFVLCAYQDFCRTLVWIGRSQTRGIGNTIEECGVVLYVCDASIYDGSMFWISSVRFFRPWGCGPLRMPNA